LPCSGEMKYGKLTNLPALSDGPETVGMFLRTSDFDHSRGELRRCAPRYLFGRLGSQNHRGGIEATDQFGAASRESSSAASYTLNCHRSAESARTRESSFLMRNWRSIEPAPTDWLALFLDVPATAASNETMRARSCGRGVVEVVGRQQRQRDESPAAAAPRLPRTWSRAVHPLPGRSAEPSVFS